MNHLQRILHHFAKDVRAQAAILAVWGFLLALIFVASPHLGWTRSPLLILHVLLPGVVTMLGLVLIILTQFQDTVPDHEAAWLTRPLRPMEIFGARLVFVVALVSLLAAQDILLVGDAVGFPAAMLSIPRQLLVLAPAGLLFLALGSLAKGVRDLLVIAAVLLVLSLTLTAIGQRISHSESGLAADAALVRDDALRATRAVLVSIIVSLAGFGTALHQFITRRTARSIAILLIGLALAVAAGSFWPWRLFAEDTIRAADRGAAAAPSVEAVALSARRPEPYLSPTATVDSFGRTIASGRSLTVPVEVAGLPSGAGIRTLRARTRILAPDGSHLDLAGSNPDHLPVAADAVAEQLGLENIGDFRARGDGANDSSLEIDLHLGRLTEEEHALVRNVPVALDITVELEVTSRRISGEIALEEGLRSQLAGQALLIRGVEVEESHRKGIGPDGPYDHREPETIVVDFHARLPKWTHSPGEPLWKIFATRPSPMSEFVFLLVNRSRGQLLGSNTWGGGTTPRAGSVIVDLDYTVRFQKASSQAADSAPPIWDRTWIDDATLALVQPEVLGTVTRTLRIEDVILADSEPR